MCFVLPGFYSWMYIKKRHGFLVVTTYFCKASEPPDSERFVPFDDGGTVLFETSVETDESRSPHAGWPRGHQFNRATHIEGNACPWETWATFGGPGKTVLLLRCIECSYDMTHLIDDMVSLYYSVHDFQTLSTY